MPEEDNSILGESVYQHLRYSEERTTPSQTQAQSHSVDLKMFEQQQEQMNSLGRSGYTTYKPVLKKIGSRHMLVLNNQQTLSRGSTSKI